MKNKQKIAILGGGISGLATAYYLHKNNPSIEITLFEKNKQLGGKIHTYTEDGFLYETAANGVLSSRYETFELAKELGCKIIKADESANTRYLMRNQKLNAIPKSIKQILFWRHVSLRAKFSLLKDIFCKKNNDDISIEEFSKKHANKEISDYIINPICNGIFGSDSQKLSLQSCFPNLYELQKSYGSIIKGLYGNKKNKDEKSKHPTLQSFEGGMQTLINHLVKELDEKITIQNNCLITKVTENTITIADKQQKFDYIISTLPTYQISKLINSAIKESIQKIHYNDMVVVCVGYKNLTQDKAFGYLVPKCEKSQILGVLYSSSIFPQNNKNCLFRFMLGAEKITDLINLSDSKIMQIVEDELQKTLTINQQPDFVKIIRHKNAIPIYTINHQKIVSKIEQTNKISKLIISGSGLFGISVNDCIKQAKKIASELN